MATADPTAIDAGRMTRIQRVALPLSAEVAQALANADFRAVGWGKGQANS
jgi:hypothetical protein